MTANDFRNLVGPHTHWATVGFLQPGQSEEGRLVICGRRVEPLTVTDADLNCCVLNGSDLSGSSFVRCDLSGALLNECILRECTFHKCYFRKAELNGADCARADFAGSNLSRLELSRANLQGAILDGCDLSWLSFGCSDLRNASLQGVNLDNTWFWKTKLYNKRQFQVRNLDKAKVCDVFVDELAQGPTQSGTEALAFLSAC